MTILTMVFIQENVWPFCQEAKKSGRNNEVTYSLRSCPLPLLPGPSRRLAPVIKCNAFLCFQSYIVRDISLTEVYRWLVTFIEILSTILKSTSRGVKRKIIAFWTTRFPAFTMYQFMSKNLRVNIWRDKFTSDRLRVNLPS